MSEISKSVSFISTDQILNKNVGQNSRISIFGVSVRTCVHVYLLPQNMLLLEISSFFKKDLHGRSNTTAHNTICANYHHRKRTTRWCEGLRQGYGPLWSLFSCWRFCFSRSRFPRWDSIHHQFQRFEMDWFLLFIASLFLLRWPRQRENQPDR